MKKSKVLIGILVLNLIIGCLPISAASYSTTKANKKTVTVSTTNYYLQNLYDTGTLVPTDNARVKGTVGAKVNKARQVIYYLNDGSTSTGRKQYQSFSLIALSSNGVEKVSWGAELGKDKATGYVYTRVYNGAHTVNSSTDTNNCTTGHSIVASQDLTITS